MNEIDKIWAADLVEMQAFSKSNRGVRYLLTVIDVFSKYGWMLPLKDKIGKSVADAFKEIFKKSKRKLLSSSCLLNMNFLESSKNKAKESSIMV